MSSSETKKPYEWKRPKIDWKAHIERVMKSRGGKAFDPSKIYMADGGEGSLDDLENFSHPTFVMCPKDSPLGAMIIGSMFANNTGHTKLKVVHNPGVGTTIDAIADVEVTVKGKRQIPFAFGACQKAAAGAIDYCCSVGILPKDPIVCARLVIGIEIYVDEKANDLERVQDNMLVALVQAIVNAMCGGTTHEEAMAGSKAAHVFVNKPLLEAPDLKALGLETQA